MTLAEKYKEMFVEGREEGLVEGEERGMAKAKASLIENLQRNGLSTVEIAKLVEMTEDEVARIVQSAEAK